MDRTKKIIWIFILFLALRIYFIFTFPPFIDESNYAWWGILSLKPQDGLFMPIEFWHKQPLLFWVYGFGAQIFHNPIIGERLINLIISIPPFFILYKLIKRLKNENSAIIGLAIYAFSPFLIFAQATALMDGILFDLNIVVLALVFKLRKKFSWIDALSLGIILGLTFWIKTTGLYLSITAFAALIVFRVRALTIPFIVSLGLILPLILRPNFNLILLEGQGFALPLDEIAGFPIQIWFRNLLFFIISYLLYFTPAVFAGLFSLKKDAAQKEIRILFLWFMIPTLLLILTSRMLNFRYDLFAAAPLLLIVAVGLNNLISRLKNALWIKILIFLPLLLGALLMTFYPLNFFSLIPKGSLLQIERAYVFDWPSGYGVYEAIAFFDSIKPAGGEVFLLVPALDGMSNVASYALSYYRNNLGLKIFALPKDHIDLNQIRSLAKLSPVYLISHSQLIPEEIKSYIKPLRIFSRAEGDFTGVYQIKF